MIRKLEPFFEELGRGCVGAISLGEKDVCASLLGICGEGVDDEVHLLGSFLGRDHGMVSDRWVEVRREKLLFLLFEDLGADLADGQWCLVEWK